MLECASNVRTAASTRSLLGGPDHPKSLRLGRTVAWGSPALPCGRTGEGATGDRNRLLVDFHSGLPLARHWGGGQRASSDGQRFAVEGASPLAAPYPRYFGYYDRAVSVYTHVADTHSVFASKVISCAPREALYVLDGLLDNDTVIDPKVHNVDTHDGATEPLFGLCYLLGIELQPRMASLSDLRLYMDRPDADFGALQPAIHGAVPIQLILEQWDVLARVAASLLHRTAPAHVVLRRLTSNRRSRLSQALVALGRLVKTTWLFRYMADAELRQAVRTQLNRGESRHALARRLFFGNNGVFRTGDVDQLTNKATALSVLSNAVICWNTLQLQAIADRLRPAPERRAPSAPVTPGPRPRHPTRGLQVRHPRSFARNALA